MGINISWSSESKNIIHYVFEGRWDWNDFRHAIKDAADMIDTVNHPVDVIMDFSNASMLPNGAISQVKQAFSTPKHPNINLTVIVGASAFIQSIADLGRKLSRSAAENWSIQFAPTLPAAFNLLANVMQTQDRV